MTEAPPLEVVVVTGLSGAGRSTALNALEDLGYYCVDNLPPPVVLEALQAIRDNDNAKVAFGVDVRVRAFLEGAGSAIASLRDLPGAQVKVLYLEASDDHLARRYSETRRPHPLTQDGEHTTHGVREGIALERSLLAPLRGLASMVIDTTMYTVHDLRREVIESFSREGKGAQQMLVRVQSFGFKFGAPQDADLVFDVRFLPNPYFIAELRPLSGRDEPVSSHVLGNEDAVGFLDHVVPLLEFCIPRFRKEGKSYVTIAIGCTGGRHRSVALSERIATDLSARLGFRVEAVHRDMRQAEHIAGKGAAGTRPQPKPGRDEDHE